MYIYVYIYIYICVYFTLLFSNVVIIRGWLNHQPENVGHGPSNPLTLQLIHVALDGVFYSQLLKKKKKGYPLVN